MKRLTSFLLLCSSLLLGSAGMVMAQENSGATTPPPKVLVIMREFLKPGKGGMAHEKAESAFVQAFTRAKWENHYLAVESLSGKPRVLFLTGYDSFAAWEKDGLAIQKNSALSAALDRAAAADGELLSDADQGAFVYHEEYSLRAPVDLAHMRYFEISVFHVRQGHDKDWDAIVKMVMAGYSKIPAVHWATYQSLYGQDDGTYLVFSPLKSATEIDSEFAQGKEFESAMGEEGMKKLAELSAAAIESSQTNLFAFNPQMSYASDDWVKADPDYWRPKAAGTPAGGAKKSEKKPASDH